MTTHGRNVAARAGAGLAAIAMAAGLATTPAWAGDGHERGKSDQAHGNNAHGHAQAAEPGNGNGTPPAHAGGPAAQTPPPGHQEAHPAPAKPAKPAHPAKPAKPVKAKPAHPARPARPAKPQPAAKPANPHAKAGKTTICHATGSATNPYVTITISDNALPAHARHQDGRDIIPAPAGGCPAPAARAVEIGKADLAEGRVAGSREAPAAPAAPAPAEPAASAPAGGVLGVIHSSSAPLPKLSDTLGSSARAERAESGTRAVTAAAAPRAGELPFTGLEAALVALLGLLLALTGVLVRSLTKKPARPA